MFCANDLQIKSNITSLQLENAINKIKHDHKLKGLGSAFLEAENRYNVNAIILASIACLESGYGTSKLAIEKNNLFEQPKVHSFIMNERIEKFVSILSDIVSIFSFAVGGQ